MTLSCPKCNRYASGKRGCLLWILIICLFPFGLLLLLIKPTYSCQCGYRFKS